MTAPRSTLRRSFAGLAITAATVAGLAACSSSQNDELQAEWDATDAETRTLICDTWDSARDLMVETMQQQLDDIDVDSATVEDFLDDQCA